tara:strand:- start:1557 stop:1892 length:336 start_codon:yes stop_codon:yes gene_type:complete
MSILKEAHIAKSLSLKTEEKSLFNDGVALVVSDILLIATETGEHSTAGIGAEIGTLFREEAVGGLLFGFVIFNSMCLISSVSKCFHELINNHNKPFCSTLIVSSSNALPSM